MTFEEAVSQAIEMEIAIKNLYQENANRLKSATASRIFSMLAKEEEGHIDYLNEQRKVWLKSGALDPVSIKTVVPDKKAIKNMMSNLSTKTDHANLESDVALFKKALEMETQISRFYKDLINQLPATEKSLFESFLEIEECHEAIIQAEISSANGSGVWFDFMEFDQEAG